MTFLDCSLSPKFSGKLTAQLLACLAVVCVLFACASQENYGEHNKKRKNPSLSNKFQWGVQYFEAGENAEALKTFQKLRKEGSEVPEFDLVTFYIGMSQYRLEQYPEAAQELENFLKITTARPEGQEARISLLLIYEKLNEWKKISALAAETDQLTLYQNNRALMKLLWARSLREQGEILGAKTELKNALPFLDKMGAEELNEQPSANPDQDLWGRYHFTNLLVQESSCNMPRPREFPSKSKKALPKRLYAPWIQSTVDCFRRLVKSASDELFARESTWSVAVEKNLSRGISEFAGKIQGYIKEEAPHLTSQRALQKVSQEEYYRLLGTVDDNLKVFKKRGFTSEYLISLRKEIDHLLAGFSNPSS